MGRRDEHDDDRPSADGSGPTLYLIDGYAAIFRAFFAIRRPLISPATGEPTQAVLVFAGMLLKLLSRFRPDYLAVALDAPGRTFRDDLYAAYPPLLPPGVEVAPLADAPVAAEGPAAPAAAVPGPFHAYKGNRRAGMPDGLVEQIPRILELLRLFGVPIVEKPGLEADDVIATLTERILRDPAHDDLRIRIVSRDKDLEQLLSPRVALFDVHTETITDPATLYARKGVTPGQVADLLALAGDSVDNIPGVPGIGPRTAAQLIQRFGSLDGVLAHLDEVPGKQRQRNLRDALGYLPVSRALVTLKRDADIPFSLDDARVGPPRVDEIVALFRQLGFNRLQDEVRRLHPETEHGDPAADPDPPAS
jgi:5'-3' exonuclease